MKAQLRTLLMLVPMALLPTGVCLGQGSSVVSDTIGAHWSLGAFSGAGFAGANIRQAVAVPAFSNGEFVADSVDLVKNSIFRWKPTVAAGIVFRRQFSRGLRVGFSGYFAFLTEEDGNSNPAPGFAFHMGSTRFEMFVGYIATSSNDVRFPTGTTRLRVHKDTIPDLTVEETRSLGRIYIGFRGVDITIAGKDGAGAKLALFEAEAAAKIAFDSLDDEAAAAEDAAEVAEKASNDARQEATNTAVTAADTNLAGADKINAEAAKNAAAEAAETAAAEAIAKAGAAVRARAAANGAKEVLEKASAEIAKAGSS